MSYIKIAFRSVLKHKNKLISIGLLVMFGTIMIIVGQSFVDSIKYNSRDSIIRNFTGHLIIYSAKSKEEPSPFSFSAPLKPIENLDKIEKLLDSFKEIKAYVPMAQNMGMITQEGKEDIMVLFNAIDPESYKKIFKNTKVIEGSFFEEPGLLISKQNLQHYKEEYGIELNVGDTVNLLGFTTGGSVNAVKTKIVGIFDTSQFKNMTSIMNLIDINTYQKLYNFEGVDENSLPEQLQKSYSDASDEDIFALADEEIISDKDISNIKFKKSSGFTMVSVLLDSSFNTDKKIDAFISKLNKYASQYGFKVARWDTASGGLASISKSLQIFILIASIIIFITVGIIIMNTLIVNVLERVAEIGTMRAIGAKKSFIRKMFIVESFFLNMLAAIAGIVISIIIIMILHKSGLEIKGMFAEMLYGGGKLFLSLNLKAIIQSLTIVFIISIIATLYPVKIATKITPLKAMQDK